MHYLGILRHISSFRICFIHVFGSRGFQLSESNHAVESCKEIFGNHSSGDSNEAGKKLRVHHINTNSGSSETVDLVFYMDKNEKACNLRDIVVCCKENTYHVVKDICVDQDVSV
ncbi:unnamed protein product [Brassica oleracea]